MDIRYARSGDVDIAYRVLGDGPLTLVYVDGSFTNLEVMWEHPHYRHFCERLASFSRLILFDKRGMGLSDRAEIGTLEERMEDVRAVLDDVGAEKAALLGVSEGGPMSMLFAASYPGRTAALVLCGAEVKEEITDDWPWGELTLAGFEESLAGLPKRWGKGLSAARFTPDAPDEDFERAWWAKVQLQSATPRVAIAFQRMAFGIDVRHVVSTIMVPTLVIHRVGDLVCHVENGRFLARTIRNAQYVELPGNDHGPYASSGGDIADEIQEFLTGVREPEKPDRVLATVLFTDIVGSTELARELGDRDWRELLDRHHETVRRQLERFRGREVDTAGDGFFATFDGPARGIRCGRAIVDSVRSMGLEIRTGLHTGEVELAGDGIRGIAVHTGARVAAQAAPGEVLVSSTVKDLVAGSGIEFTDRGVHELKGIPGEWRLYAAE
jgi:class 3 adenylate cyclase